ncbi:MAG TPA: hypothetical protein VM238_11455 [Phycisphaerae bacterium]|nr:hypothetical protein [Phycisphaerae bacterium]
MRRLLWLVILAALAHRAIAAFGSDEEIDRWLMSYYKKPDPNSVSEAVRAMSRSGLLDKTTAQAPLLGFLAGVFRDNPERVAGWLKTFGSLKGAHRAVVVRALWHSGLPDSQKLAYGMLDADPTLKKSFASFYKRTPTPIEQVPIQLGPWVLDALWGNFSATGKKAPVARIMTALPWSDPGKDISRMLIGHAATWSLTANAVQHPKVMAFCEEEVKTQPDDVAKKLTSVIAKAKKRVEERAKGENRGNAPKREEQLQGAPP